MARQYSLRPGADATGGDLGYVTRDQLGVLGERVFAAAPGSVLGPIEVKGRYVLLAVGDRQPARPATFEEARAEVERQLRPAFEKRWFRAYVDSLRRHHPVHVHREAAHRLAAELDAGPTS
ncbi:MAG: peptidyl-prolyl cis-trans isomerase [Bacteroidetes bacterium]|nr:MAG: peptidyl-prolyl cis-trans isomerase [Bacteroidota bacterium]